MSRESTKQARPPVTKNSENHLKIDRHLFLKTIPRGTPTSVLKNLRGDTPLIKIIKAKNEFYTQEFKKIYERKKKTQFKTSAVKAERKKNLDLKALLKMDFLGPNDPFLKMVDGALNEQLKKEGLYSEEGQEVAFSEVFVTAQSKNDKRSNIVREKRGVLWSRRAYNADIFIVSYLDFNNLMSDD